MIRSDGTACVADYGLAQIFAEVDYSFSSASLAGPVRWLAVEVMTSECESAVPYTKESDVYAFAMTVIEVSLITTNITAKN